MAQDFLNQSDRDVQRLVEDLEDVIRSPLENDMASVKQVRGLFRQKWVFGVNREIWGFWDIWGF